MPRPAKVLLDATPAESSAPSSAAAPGFAGLARRVSALATNVLATALVLLLGLVVGREVIGLWRADDEVASSETIRDVAAQPSEPRPAVAQFGAQGPPLELRTVQGDRKAAIVALREMCRSAIAAQGNPSSQPVTAEERRLLSTVTNMAPSESTPHGEIYELPGAVPVVVAITGQTSEQRRVAYCGLALSPAAGGWSLYGIRWQQRGDESKKAAVPLPPQTQRVMSLATDATATTLVFTGAGPAEAWQAFYRSAATDRAWRTLRDWQRSGYDWQASYEQQDAESLVRRFDIQLSSDPLGRWRGLITTTTRRAPAKE